LLPHIYIPKKTLKINVLAMILGISNLNQLYSILKVSFKDWLKDKAPTMAASLTFFIILPLPTLLLIVIDIFAQFVGQSQATQILMQQITAITGSAVAALFAELIANAGSPFTTVSSTIIVVGFSVGGAIGAFSVLRETMDSIWEVEPPKGLPFRAKIRKTIGPFVLASLLGIVVLIWEAIAGNIFSAMTLYSINQTTLFIALTVSQILLSFALIALLLAIIYKIIPQVKIDWHDVTLASIITSIAFTIINYSFGAYIQTFTVTTVAGTAGALLIILLWIFSLNQIVLYGVEVSKVYASTVGKHARQSLNETIEKAIEPLQKAGEKIEDSAKEKVVETGEPRVEPEDQNEIEKQSD
jgi:membrane protein